MKKITYIIICILLLNFGVSQSISISSQMVEDFDPLSDINIFVDILSIRALEDFDKTKSEPDFFLKIYINNNEYISEIWHDTSYLYEKPFSLTVDVPDDEEFVTVKIQLWEWNLEGNLLCDIGNETSDVTVQYNIKTGHWSGQDELYDASGYGRLNGCDDGSIYLDELDCEIWFNIYQTDYDLDTLPYWIEINTYHTDPMISNLNEDVDNDGLPIEYEHQWEFDPNIPEDHQNNDYDVDSLNNYEEFLTKEQPISIPI